jgi:hypothetical protein
MEVPDSLLSWEILKTFSGLVLTTWVVVQFLKDFLFFRRMPTRLLALAVAELLLFAVSYATGELNPAQFILNLLNGVFVALAAMKGHEVVVEKRIKGA